jgi:drug/metabolite transporter (DMT)-like permease
MWGIRSTMGWVSLHAVAILSALLAAFWAAVGIVVRQRVAQGVPADKAMSGTMVTSLVREPLWWAGTLAAVAGYVFQAIALAHGSLLLVQPLLVSSLLFALPLSARLCHQRVSWDEWAWAVLLTTALALVITVPLVTGCIVAARRAVGRSRAMLLAVAVAVVLGMIAVLTKVCTHRFAVGGWHELLTVPAPYVLVALAVVLTVLQQSAFHAGALQASVPIMLVGEPVVAVLLGIVVLGEHLAVRDSASLVLAVAVLAMVAATIALARGQAPEADSLPTRPDAPDPGMDEFPVAAASKVTSFGHE